MIVHMVLLKVKKSVSAAKIARVMKLVGEMRRKTPGITGYTWGRYASPEGLNQGFTHGFCMTFKDARSRDAYLPHPAHDIVKAKVLEILDGDVRGVIAFDYEA